ncbi:MAG: DUF6266 family protein [Balneolaceae bacterium]
MAKLSKGILGGISGKIGNIVGASWRGIDYIRSKPSKVNNPKTEAQQRQRARFGLIMALLKKMKPFLQIGFRGSANKQTPLNAAMSVNIREAITGEFPDFEVDTSKLAVSTGNLHGSSNASLDLSAAENATITWQSEAGISNASDEDVLMVLLYNQARNEVINKLNAALREDETLSLSIPSSWSGDTVAGYLAFRSDTLNDVSNGIYLGEEVAA